MIEIRELHTDKAHLYLDQLADVLFDCVKGGASVNFMASFTMPEARAFFERVLEDVHRGDRILLAAFVDSSLAGTVQIVTATPPNQPHRADIAKLLVHRTFRGRGVAARLMQHAEEVGRREGRTLLTLDTVTGEAGERVYMRLGWTKAGVIPNYALRPDGTPCSTSIFWKELSQGNA